MRLIGWHGSHNWSGEPVIRAPRKGKYEYGAGIYLTTSLERAKRYAKGGGRVVPMAVELSAAPEPHNLTVAEIVNFVNSCPGLRKRKEVVADIHKSAEMSNRTLMPASVVNNLAVNNEALTSASAGHVAAWLAEHGMPVSINRVWSLGSAPEEWMVVFNPALLDVSARVAQEIPPGSNQMKLFSEQLAEQVAAKLAAQIVPGYHHHDNQDDSLTAYPAP